MCVYSMIMDHYNDWWGRRIYPTPYAVPYNPIPINIEITPFPTTLPSTTPLPTYLLNPMPVTSPQISQQEIDEFHLLLDRAREYDKRNNEVDCELEEKKAKLIKLAKELGAEISFPE